MQRSRLRHRLERVGLAVGIVLAIVVIFAVFNMVLQSDQGPLEPTPESTLAPTIGPTLEATPSTPETSFDPEPLPESGSLLHMLGYAPDRLQNDSLPLSDIAQYADIVRWMESQGIPTPTGPDDPAWDSWHQQLPALAIPEVFATRGTDDIWIQTYGFGLHQVDQILAVGSAPDYVVVMRGDFDQEALLAAWSESGYQAVRVDGVTYWSLNPGGSVDLSAPASRPALGNMNNIALMDDGTLIATARSGRLEETIRTVQGSSPSLAENDDIRTLMAPGTDPDLLVTATLLKGSVLEEHLSTPKVLSIATPAPELPQARLVLAGLHIVPNGEQRTSMVVVVVFDSADDATGAHNRARKELASGTSPVTDSAYSDRAKPLSMRVVAAGGNDHLLVMHLMLAEGPGDWLQVIEERDLGYLMWPRVP